MAKVKVTKIFKCGAKIHKATLEGPEGQKLEGIKSEVRWWIDSPFTEIMKEGEVVDLKVKAQENYEKTGDEHWIESVNGVTAEKKAGAKGGGGARAYTPKSREEIHGPGISGIIKSCIENGISTEQAREWLKLYSTECANYQTVTSGRPGAS